MRKYLVCIFVTVVIVFVAVNQFWSDANMHLWIVYAREFIYFYQMTAEQGLFVSLML